MCRTCGAGQQSPEAKIKCPAACTGCGDGVCDVRNDEPKFTIRDSGDRTQFQTGSVRDRRAGKGRPDLISPLFLKRLAVHTELGATKYSERNWEKGQPLGASFFGSAKRHLDQWFCGDTTEDHLSAAAWNIMCLMQTEWMIQHGRLPKELDDRPKNFGGMV